ncbi:DUF1275 family protein [Actinoplanes missouriensis]|uniref:DUF1275 family protein n=1 Tax=Actinoplanes missouriensis TaxID=1866 RepID=UPI0036C22930
MPELRSPRAGAAVLAATAGATDLLALTDLGGAFASIVTGNLVTAGYAIATADLQRLVPVAVAVTGYALGVILWSLPWTRQLLAEFALLMTVAAPLPATLRLFTAAVAMGGQSVIGLRLGAVTTYLTGALATALRDLTAGRRKASVTVLIQLVSLVTGAAVTAGIRVVAPSAALFVPPFLVVIAAVLLTPVKGASR